MAIGTVHRTIKLLQGALEQLHVEVPLGDLETIGVIVNRAMSSQERSFHTPEHIFDLAEPDNPHMTLAALFHDVVYYQVDQGFTPAIERIVSPYISIRDGSIYLVDDISQSDRGFWGCAAVFGFKAGQELSPFAGLNEFLSALVMAKIFESEIADRDLLIVTACIEATIPFRGPDSDGRCPSEVLELRIRATESMFNLGLSNGAIEQTVRSAVTFANKDVKNFAEDNVGRFLDNTWKLLPETNPSLRMTGMYSVGSYRVALQKMEGFLNFLDPATIFCQFDGTPPDKEYDELLQRAIRNVDVAREYLGIKLLAAAILEAIAEVSGGDAPISLFMGDINVTEKGGKLSDFLPEATKKKEKPIEKTLYNLLALGRGSASSFDLRNSPLSLYVYLLLGTEGFHDSLKKAKLMFADDIVHDEFLKSLPPELLQNVASAIGHMAFTRQPALEKYLRSAP